MWGFAPEPPPPQPPKPSSTPLQPPLWWSEHFTGPPPAAADPPYPPPVRGFPLLPLQELVVMVLVVGQEGVMVPPPELYFSHPQVSFSSDFVYLEMGSFLCLLYGGGTMREMSIKSTSG